jgi:hypothetical protein
VEDNAFAVARFFQRGGSFHNYYMVMKYLWNGSGTSHSSHVMIKVIAEVSRDNILDWKSNIVYTFRFIKGQKESNFFLNLK